MWQVFTPLRAVLAGSIEHEARASATTAWSSACLWQPSPFFRASGHLCCCRLESAALSAAWWLSMQPDQSRCLEELALHMAEQTVAAVARTSAPTTRSHH